MAKGRYGGPKQKKGGGVVTNRVGRDAPTYANVGPIFVRADEDVSTARFASPLLLTLIFKGKVEQHCALARIEAFYEATPSDTERQFLTLQQASQRRLCPNYEAFNCPVAVVREWLVCMQRAHGISPALATNGESKDDDVDDENKHDLSTAKLWWKPYCNVEEAELLVYLANLGCLDGDTNDTEQRAANAPRYIITALASQASSSLPHERLHFLYFVSQSYRDLSQRQFASLSAKARKVIETDLNMRGYARHVHLDEFQAYVSLDSAEFGKHISDECASVQLILLSAQRDLWISLAAGRQGPGDDEADSLL